MTKKIIEIKNLNKSYGIHKKTSVLHDLNLSIDKKSFVWIIGASGSGKTTLLNIISGLDEASSGDVIIDGINLSILSKKERSYFRAHHLGFIFQFHYLLPEYRAYENVLLPLRIQEKKITKALKKEVDDLLAFVKIDHVKHHYPSQMSGGEQQRAAVARAVISKPKLILADEPTGNLDSESAKQVYTLLRNLYQNHDTTFVIVTHDRIVPEPGDRMITLKDGVIIKDVIY